MIQDGPPDAASRPASAIAGRLLSLPGGAVLAACFFLPAVRSCEESVYPYELPAFAVPYAMGLLVAVFAVLALVLGGRLPRWLSAAHTAILCLGVIAAAAYFAFGTVGEILDGWNGWLRLLPLAGPLAGCVALVAFAAPVISRGRSPDWREARATWAFGAATFLWLLQWALDRFTLLYGWWLSVAASLLVVAGGALLESASRTASSRDHARV